MLPRSKRTSSTHSDLGANVKTERCLVCSVDVRNNKTAVKGLILLFEWKGDESFVLERCFFICSSLYEASKLKNKFGSQPPWAVRLTNLDYYFLSPKGCLFRNENQLEMSREKEICT